MVGHASALIIGWLIVRHETPQLAAVPEADRCQALLVVRKRSRVRASLANPDADLSKHHAAAPSVQQA